MILSGINKEGIVKNKLFELADKLRAKSLVRDIETELCRIALIVLSDRTEDISSYERKRTKKKAEDQKLNLSWGIDSFCQLQDEDMRLIYDFFSDLDLEEIRKVFAALLTHNRYGHYQGITRAGLEALLEQLNSSKDITVINADSILEHYELINKLEHIRLYFRNRSSLPMANLMFINSIQKEIFVDIEEIKDRSAHFLHLGPFNFKPMNERRHTRILFNTVQEDEIFELQKKNPKSNIIALLPISVSFNFQSRKFRDEINQTNRIKSITEASDKALEYTNIQTFILNLGVRTSDTAIKIKAKDKQAISISQGQLYEQEDWSLLRHYSTGYKLSIDSIALGEVVLDSFRGPNLKKSDKGEEVFVIQNKDLKENDLIKCEEVEPEKYEFKGSLDRYYLEEDDILIVCRGYNFSTAVVKNVQDKKVVASSNILVVRLEKKHVDPKFIYLFLSSPLGKAELESRQIGTAQLILSIKDIKSIQVPALKKSDQSLLSERFTLATTRKNAEFKRITKEYEQETNALYEMMGIKTEKNT